MAIIKDNEVISGGIGVISVTYAEYLANKDKYDKSGNFIKITDATFDMIDRLMHQS